MIIQCDKCQTKFRLDDAKIKDDGVKVRCAKCRNVFRVARDVQEVGQRADFGEMFDDSVASGQEAVAPDAEQEQTAEFTDSIPDDVPEFGAVHPVGEDTLGGELTFDSTLFDEPLAITEEKTPDQPTAEEFAFPALAAEDPAGDSPIDFKADDLSAVDFGSFDFGTAATSAEEQGAESDSFDFGDASETKASTTPPPRKEFGGLDFSDDDMFGEVAPQAPEEPTESIAFDLGMEGFADAMKTDDSFTGRKDSFGAAETSADEPFSLDEIDFGDDLTAVAIQQVNPEELKPSQEILFGPLAEAPVRPDGQDATNIVFDTTPAAADQELPPLSIASRRKQGPISSAMKAVIGVVAVAAIGLIGYFMTAGDSKQTVQETGRIMIRKVDASFVKNKSAGDLLVISGEVVNEYSKPRAAIQVKGMVYGADGKVIASKNAFCGNPMTPQQLETMPQDKIEAAMANQFGVSLVNMDVAPGKAVAFVIVMPKPDAAAKDYGVEPAGSTDAAAKQ
jgi:predicted Zn finger-like uncharacterized protein